MSVDNPEQTSRTVLAKLYDAGALQKSRAGGTAEAEFYYKKVSVDEALVDLENYYKAQASEDLSEDHPSDIHKALFTYGEVCDKEGALSPRAVEIRMDLSAYYSKYVWQPKTTASKGYKVEGE